MQHIKKTYTYLFHNSAERGDGLVVVHVKACPRLHALPLGVHQVHATLLVLDFRGQRTAVAAVDNKNVVVSKPGTQTHLVGQSNQLLVLRAGVIERAYGGDSAVRKHEQHKLQ